jgi:hypothetical protein
MALHVLVIKNGISNIIHPMNIHQWKDMQEVGMVQQSSASVKECVANQLPGSGSFDTEKESSYQPQVA